MDQDDEEEADSGEEYQVAASPRSSSGCYNFNTYIQYQPLRTDSLCQ